MYATFKDFAKLVRNAREMTDLGGVESRVGYTVWGASIALSGRISTRNFNFFSEMITEASKPSPDHEVITAGLNRLQRVRERIG